MNKKTDKKTQVFRRSSAIFASLVLLFGVSLAVRAQSVANENINAAPSLTETVEPEVDLLNQQIDEKQKQIDELKRQQAVYERQLDQKREQRETLATELSNIQDSLVTTETSLEITRTQIEALQLEIDKVQREINQKEEAIAQRQSELAALLRQIYESDQVSNLEILVEEQSFSSFFSRVQTLHNLSTSVESALREVTEVKRQLDVSKEDLDATRAELDTKRSELEAAQAMYQQQESYKENLLLSTQSSELVYQTMLGELRDQSASVDGEITSLIDQVNDRLAESGQPTQTPVSSLSWPIEPARGVSAYFHDPGYPFRHIFEHPAIDIRAYQGTPVEAAADGVVAIARHLDWVRDAKGKILWPAYNFVTIVHAGNIATVYGHLNVVNVTEGQSVKRGQLIGKSGATPGTAGAGRLTTGPHLHFEVRLNGIPVDPLKYLPEREGV